MADQQARLAALKNELHSGGQGLPVIFVYTKKVICFIGLPGAGKSTQIDRLSTRLQAPVFHLAKIGGKLHLEINGQPLAIEEAIGSSSYTAAELDSEVFRQVGSVMLSACDSRWFSQISRTSSTLSWRG